MEERTIYITEYDLKRLREFIVEAKLIRTSRERVLG